MARVYIDSSAALRRVFDDERSAQARRIFMAHVTDADQLVSSALLDVEVARGVRARALRLGKPASPDQFTEPGSGVSLMPIDDAVLSLAREVGPDELRSPHAIHLATAVSVGADVMVTYDARLGDAARAWGMSVEPG